MRTAFTLICEAKVQDEEFIGHHMHGMACKDFYILHPAHALVATVRSLLPAPAHLVFKLLYLALVLHLVASGCNCETSEVIHLRGLHLRRDRYVFCCCSHAGIFLRPEKLRHPLQIVQQKAEQTQGRLRALAKRRGANFNFRERE